MGIALHRDARSVYEALRVSRWVVAEPKGIKNVYLAPREPASSIADVFAMSARALLNRDWLAVAAIV